MDVNPMDIAQARLAVREAGRYLFDRARKINMIDIGLKESGGEILNVLAIRFHVDEKLSGFQLEEADREQLPPSIGPFSIPTDVVVGKYRLHQLPWWGGRRTPANSPTARANPMRGGISISDENHIAAGTLGCKVIDRTIGTEMLLSNWHVLVADWGARRGQRIFQPGRLDGGTSADTIATLTREAMSVNLDAAVATLNGGRPLINDQFDLGMLTGVGQAAIGMEVEKSGRSTRVTHGRVVGVGGIAKLPYRGLERVIREVVTVEPLVEFEEFSRGGDSGSVYINPATMEAIALHFAGSDIPERGLGIDMQSILDALNVGLATAQESRIRPQTIQTARRTRQVANVRGAVAHAPTHLPEAETEVAKKLVLA